MAREPGWDCHRHRSRPYAARRTASWSRRLLHRGRVREDVTLRRCDSSFSVWTRRAARACSSSMRWPASGRCPASPWPACSPPPNARRLRHRPVPECSTTCRWHPASCTGWSSTWNRIRPRTRRPWRPSCTTRHDRALLRPGGEHAHGPRRRCGARPPPGRLRLDARGGSRDEGRSRRCARPVDQHPLGTEGEDLIGMPTPTEDGAGHPCTSCSYRHTTSTAGRMLDGVADLFTEDGVFDPGLAGSIPSRPRAHSGVSWASMAVGTASTRLPLMMPTTSTATSPWPSCCSWWSPGAVVTVGRYHRRARVH